MTDLSIIISGAAGRMGRAIVREAAAASNIRLAGAIEHAQSPDLGRDVGAVAGLDDLGVIVATAGDATLADADVVIDFSAPAAAVALAQAASKAGVAHVIGATGFSDAQEAVIAKAAATIPIVKSGNMSLGVNLMTALVEQAAKALPDDYDIEIIDIHHRHKVDAPSGTALMIGEAAASGRGRALDDAAVGFDTGRAGAREPGQIGFAVLRGGGVIGEHEAHFAGPHEVLTVSHRAIDRSLFARGAITAARWVATRPPGLYSMRDVIGLNQD
ncbi:MAG: 4-hydroxy-tetrahydrodipicolinate reductase [Pseudomonadota bacterium]